MTNMQEHRHQQQRLNGRRSDQASRIVSAALERVASATTPSLPSCSDILASSSSSSSSGNVVNIDSLRRHAETVAAEESDILTLQSQLALALHALDRMASSEQQQQQQQQQNNQDQLRQLQAQDPQAEANNSEEVEQSTMYAATLQVDLVRTRERMNDALSIAKTSSSGCRRSSSRSFTDEVIVNISEEEKEEDLMVCEIEGQLNDLPADGNTFNTFHTNNVANNTSDNEMNIHDTPNAANSSVNDKDNVLMASIASLTFDLTKVREQLKDERSAVKHNRRRSSSHGHAKKKRGSVLSCNSRDAIEEFDVVAAVPAEDLADATATTTTTTTALHPPSSSTSIEAPDNSPTAASTAAGATTSDKLDSEVQQQQQQQQQQRPVLKRRASRRNSFVGSAA